MFQHQNNRSTLQLPQDTEKLQFQANKVNETDQTAQNLLSAFKQHEKLETNQAKEAFPDGTGQNQQIYGALSMHSQASERTKQKPQRSSSHNPIKVSSKQDQQMQNNLSYIRSVNDGQSNRSQQRKGSSKSQGCTPMSQKEDDRIVIQMLTSQVLSKIIDREQQEGQLADDGDLNGVEIMSEGPKNQVMSDDGECDSDDLNENKRIKDATIKRKIDHQKKINQVQKELLTFMLNDYDNVLQRKKIDDEIDFLTGSMVKPVQQDQNQYKQINDSYYQQYKDEELQEMQSLQSVPIRGQFNEENLEKLQNFLKELLRANVEKCYKDSKESIEKRNEMVGSAYYKTYDLIYNQKNMSFEKYKQEVKSNLWAIQEEMRMNEEEEQEEYEVEVEEEQQEYDNVQRYRSAPIETLDFQKANNYEDLYSTSSPEVSPTVSGNFQLRQNKRIQLMRMEDIEEIEDEMESKQRSQLIYSKSPRERGESLASKKLYHYPASTASLKGNSKTMYNQEDLDEVQAKSMAIASVKCESLEDDRDTLLDEYNQEMDEKVISSSKSNVRSSIIKQKTLTDLKKVRISVKETPDVSEEASSKQLSSKQLNSVQEETVQRTKSKDYPTNVQIVNDNPSKPNFIQSNLFKNMFQKPIVSELREQKTKYLANRKKIDVYHRDLESTNKIKERLKTGRVQCMKYNYSLDEETQKVPSYDGYIQLSQDGKYLNIINKKVIRKLEYKHDPDYRVIRKKREEFQQSLLKGENGEILEENFKESIDYVYKKSNCSMALDDIQAILFGGISSRFWMLRKHMICQNIKKMMDHKTAFYSWQCLTIQLKHRDIDLVIPNDQDMDDVLEVIIEAMNTVNGSKNSANIIKEQMHLLKYKQECKRQKEIDQRDAMSEIKFIDKDEIWQQQALTREEKHQIKRTTCMKYKIMRIRAKISFLAFQKQLTVCELMLNQVQKSFATIAKLKEDELSDVNDQFEIFRMNDHAFQKLLNEGMDNIFKQIMQLNVDKVRSNDMIFYIKMKYQQTLDICDKNVEDEVFEVKDNMTGKTKTHKINQLTNLQKASGNVELMCKTRATDLFLQMGNDGAADLLRTINYRDIVKYNQQKEKLVKLYSKLKVVINLKAVTGIMMLKALITKIKVAKQIFVLEIEQMKEAYIPNELSNDNLPSSFWFYDACLQQVQNLIVQEKKDFATFKNEYRLNFYQKKNFRKQLAMKLGLIDDPSYEVKMALKAQLINEVETNIINHQNITNAMSLQRSRYVIIDEDVNSLQKHYTIQGKNQQRELEKQIAISGCNQHCRLSADIRNEARNLILRYCPDEEITYKCQEMLQVKSTFLNKICFMKIMGKKLLLMQRVDSHIQGNIDAIYQEYIKYHPRKLKGVKSLYEVIMAEKLEAEELEHAKKKLHSRMMDEIEQWLQNKSIKLRQQTIKDVRDKNEKTLHFHTKNYFVDTGLEKHIRWYSKGRRFDIKEMLIQEMEHVKMKQKELKHRHHQQMLESQDPQALRDLEMKSKLENMAKQQNCKFSALKKEMHMMMMKGNMERITCLKQKVATQERETLEVAAKLNNQRGLYQKLLGLQNQVAFRKIMGLEK